MKNSGWHFVNGQFWKGGCASRRCRNGRLDGSTLLSLKTCDVYGESYDSSWSWSRCCPDPADHQSSAPHDPQYQAPRAKPYHRPDPVFQAIGPAMKAISGAVFHANRASERAGADSEHWQKRKDQHEQDINWLFDLRALHPSIHASVINMTICRGFRSQQIVRRGPLTKPLQASLSNRSCRALSEDACTVVVVICITSIQQFLCRHWHRRDWFPVKRPRRRRPYGNRIHVSIVSQNMGFKYLFMLPSNSTRVYFVTNDGVGIKAGPGERQRSNVPGEAIIQHEDWCNFSCVNCCNKKKPWDSSHAV